MELCNDEHQQICFDGRSCPLCDSCDLVVKKDNEILRLEEKIEDLEDTLRAWAWERDSK
jgi:hypothetical protein